MNLFSKALVATLGVGATAGAGVASHMYLFPKEKNESFAELLNGSILSLTGSSNQKEWELRLEELKAKKSNVSAPLTTIATQTWTNLQTWCKDNSRNDSKKSNNYQSFEEFCTWKVGDKKWENKIDAKTVNTDTKWEKAYDELKKKNRTELSTKLQLVYDKQKTGNTHKEAMHKWCTDSYKNTWKGENNESFIEVKKYCKASQ